MALWAHCGLNCAWSFVLPLKIRGRILVFAAGRCVDFRADWRPGIKRRAKGVRARPRRCADPPGKNGRQAGIADQASRSDAAHIAVGHEKRVIVRKTLARRNSLAFVFWRHVAKQRQAGRAGPPGPQGQQPC